MQETRTPGLWVAIVNDHGAQWVEGLGFADVASGRPATGDTLFRIGSVSKAFVSLAVLKLSQEGRLSLDDTVKRLAPEVALENAWETSDPVRIVNLLEHSTSWDDVSFREFVQDQPQVSLAQSLAFDPRVRRSRWRPGTRMAYSNAGPIVAAYIVEKVAGRDFEEYAADAAPRKRQGPYAQGGYNFDAGHQHVCNAARWPHRVLIGRLIGDRLRMKHGNVRIHAGLQAMGIPADSNRFRDA